MKKICILTSVHPPFDGRIFHKEAKALVKMGYNVVLIAQHNKEETVDGVRIVPLSKPKNRFERIAVDKIVKEHAVIMLFNLMNADNLFIPIIVATMIKGTNVI